MPGVTISTAVRTGPTNATVRSSSQLFIAGFAERGPVGSVVTVQSLEEFESRFGGYVSTAYLHPTVQAFFEEGGTRAQVSRVVGSGATEGFEVLSDSETDPTIKVWALGEGTWSTGLEIQVVDTDATLADSVAIKIWHNDTLLINTGAKTTVAGLINAINTGVSSSLYVYAVDLASENVNPLPVVSARSAFSEGAAGSAAVLADYSTALELFDDSYGDGAVSIPETSLETVQKALVDHANTNNRLAILHSSSSATSGDAIDDAAAITAYDNAEHAAYYFPWVYVPTAVSGVSRLIPPDGYVAAKRALAHNQTGPHQPAAGLLSKARFVSGVASDVDAAAGDTLDEAGVNAIRIIANSVRIYGARSCSSDSANFRYYTAQDVLNTVVVQAYSQLDDLLFSVINGRNTVYGDVQSRLISLLEGLRLLGALYEAYDANGNKTDIGYTVKCNASINPITQVANGIIKAEVGVRVSSIGDRINVTIVKSNLTTSVV